MALTYQQAVDLIVERAINRSFDDDAVERLAKCFKTVGIKTQVDAGELGGKVEPYAIVAQYNGGRPKVEFQPPDENSKIPSAFVPSAFVVPTVAAPDMDQVDVREYLIFKVQAPAFKPPTTNPPTKNTWKLLDLGDATAPQVIITTQLTGCAFAIGSTVGRKYFMGHAQPPVSSTAESTGEKHAQKLRSGPVFNGLPADTNLESLFVIQRGRTSDSNTIAYGDDQLANVLGFVVGNDLSFIVAIVRPVLTALVVENVFVVTHQATSASKWTIKQV